MNPEDRQANAVRQIEPIGFFSCDQTYRSEAPRQGSLAAPFQDDSRNPGRVRLLKGQNFEQALQGLAEFERIWLLYGFHLNEHWKPMVRPPGYSHKVGVFATRSPYRPGNIGLSCVELVAIKGLELFVRAYDLLDRTPIYDIKPYLPYGDSFPEAKVGEHSISHESRPAQYEIRATPNFKLKADFLRSHDGPDLLRFARVQLSHDPRDGKHKRIKPENEKIENNRFDLAYRTWRIRFRIPPMDNREALVELLDIHTGYSGRELEPGAEDPYQDKDLHRRFLREFE